MSLEWSIAIVLIFLLVIRCPIIPLLSLLTVLGEAQGGRLWVEDQNNKANEGLEQSILQRSTSMGQTVYRNTTSDH